MSYKKIWKSTRKLLDVPDELFIDCIFQFVGIQDELLKLHYVCKKFFHILKGNEYLYRNLCLRMWDKCFVVDLPSSIMEKYYDNKFRNLFYKLNKYRFNHYGIYIKIRFATPKSLRNFDKRNGTNLEKLLLDAKSHFAHFLGTSGELTLEDLYSDHADVAELKIFYAVDIDGTSQEQVKSKKSSRMVLPKENTNFPRYYDIFQWFDDQCSGKLVCESDLETPIFSNADSHLCVVDEDGKNVWNMNEIPKHMKAIHNSFTTLFSEDYVRENEQPEEYKVVDFVPTTLEDIIQENEDRMTYTNESIFDFIIKRRRRRTENNDNNNDLVMICHIIDYQNSFGGEGSTMQQFINFLRVERISQPNLEEDFVEWKEKKEKFDYYQSLPYEERKNLPYVYRSDNVFSEVKEFGIIICSICCVGNKDNKHGMKTRRKKKTKFDPRLCSNCMFQIGNDLEGRKHDGERKVVNEIHFVKPGGGGTQSSFEDYDNKIVRNELNKFVNKKGCNVFFHDVEYEGSKDIYEKIGIDIDW